MYGSTADQKSQTHDGYAFKKMFTIYKKTEKHFDFDKSFKVWPINVINIIQISWYIQLVSTPQRHHDEIIWRIVLFIFNQGYV